MESRLSAILLAAGKSRRMGTQKQLLPFHDRPAIVCCLQAIRDAGIQDVVVVVHPDCHAVVRAMEGYPATIAVNLQTDSDMSGSVRTGVEAVSPSATGIFVCPCDHPLVRPDTYRAMAGLHNQWPGKIIIPVFQGRNGHPTLFPKSLLEEISFHPSLRDVIRAHTGRVSYSPVEDEGVVLDMDTLADYRKMLQKG